VHGDAIVAHANPPNGASAWEFTRDMPLFSALLAELAASYCVDPARVFATGAGSGALFVNLLGCFRGDALRAIALLSSVPPPPNPCMGNVAVWLLSRSNTDPMVFGAGLGNRDFWTGQNSCDVGMFVPGVPAPCVAYAGCDAGLPVRYCEYAGDALPSFVGGAVWEFFGSL
jgi:poly(3-hydroxybutyrate) depolymerase